MDRSSTEVATTMIPGSITGRSWGNDNRTLILTVTLEEGKTYKVTVSKQAMDKAGNSLSSNYSFIFSTKKGGSGTTGFDITTYLVILLIVIIVIAIIGFAILKRRKPSQDAKKEEPTRPQKGKKGAERVTTVHEETCNDCKESIPPTNECIRCSCGKHYHSKCASTVEICPKCGTDLTPRL
jgi:hypothetical protein